jgi:amino acid adenylation domain-containing protein
MNVVQEELLLEEVLEGYRLSPQQTRVWLLQQPDIPAYRVQCAISIEGDLERTALDGAIEQVVERHDVLRTAFRRVPGLTVPLQVIVDDARLSWHNVELTHFNAAEQKVRIEELFKEESARPFDFEKASLLSLSLLNLSARHSILLLSLPALCADARTLRNLTSEIIRAYVAFLQGALLSDEAVQYLQFTEWQTDLLSGSEAEARSAFQLKFESLFSSTSTLPLPFEDVSRVNESFRPESIFQHTGSHVTAKVNAVAAKYGASCSDFLLACWYTLLSRLTTQTEITVGYYCDGRKYEELHDALGLFARFVPVRCDFHDRASFVEILDQARGSADEAYEWQEYFVPAWQTPGEATPKYLEYAFEFNKELPVQSVAGATFAAHQQSAVIDRHKIKLVVHQNDDSLTFEFSYDASLFHATDVKRLAENYVTLLGSAVNNPGLAFAELEILSEAERNQLLFGWNQTRADYPEKLCLQQLFEQQCDAKPNQIAIVFEEQQLTYAELNRKANQLAHYLRSGGVGPEILVGLYMERSVEMVIALLAILKAGGAYVPIDPAYPQERLAYMIDDARLPLLLTQQSLVENVSDHAALVICFDSLNEIIAQEPTENPRLESTSDNLAYVIYTSGSTGRPKGAMLAHKGVLNCLFWMQNTYHLDQTDRFLFKTSLNFDPSVWEVFWPLSVGAAVVVARPEGNQDMRYLVKTVAEHTVTSLYLVPSLLRVFLDEPGVEECRSLKRVICGGEALAVETMNRFSALLPAELHHSYGPTETTIASAEWTCERESRRRSVPIGRPLANTQIYILGASMRPVPFNVSGELYIGGDGVGRGYLNRSDLTAERFIPDPFSNERGARLYRTGDMVRYQPDGNIEFLGRVDYQVKIRGQRIELGEIEAVLREHAMVADAAVIVREDIPGEQRLVAYITTSQTATDQFKRELHGHVSQKLPTYMVPSDIVVLDAMPLTPGGKIDRRALPAPEQMNQGGTGDDIRPQTPVEEILIGIWSDLLAIAQVAVPSNFFSLGGHSLLATQLMSRVRDAFGVEVTLRQLFEGPTIAELAEKVETALRGEDGLKSKPILPVSRDSSLPLSFAQQRLWFLAQLEPDSPLYNVSVAVRLSGQLKIKELQQTLDEIVRRHESLRTSFAVVEGEPVHVINAAGPVSLPVIDLSPEAEETREARARQLAEEEAQQAFDLSRGPLLRTQLLRLGATEHILLVTMHHIVTDGWSLGVLVKEVATLYSAYLEDLPSPLPELAIQYADFAHWQREWLQGEVLEEQLSYWRERLSGAPALLELPTDRARPAVQSFRGAHYSFSVPPELTGELQQLSRREGVTLFMTLLAAFQTLLWRYSAQDDILVGTPSAGRNRSETEQLIGFFINTLVLRTRVEGEESFAELLQQVREVCLGGYAHQDVPFEKLVEELQPVRSLSHTPLFQVMFALQNAPTAELELPGLQLAQMEDELALAKFDLSLVMQEVDGIIGGALVYSTDLFDASTMERMSGHLQTLLAAIVANPYQAVRELPLLTASEHHQLRDWNQTSAAYPQEVCLHELFEAQVQRTPEHIALSFNDHRLSYSELNHRANRLAHQLHALGVGPEVLVGLLMERSVELMVALLGILKAGGAYLPLDPSYPLERLSFMLEDARAPVLLTQSGLVELLPGYQGKTFCLEADGRLAGSESGFGEVEWDETPVSGVRAENLSYVIYTSGSTGRPKGAMNTHGAICNRLLWMQETFGLGTEDRVLQKTPISFDVSVWELFWPLIAGGRLVLAEPGGHRDSGYLWEVIKREQITTLHFVPSMLSVFLEAGEKGEASGGIGASVRRVICSGEALSYETQERFFRVAENGRALHNLYGPTEAAVDVTWWECERGSARRVVPIGKPVANTQCYVLDQWGGLAPMGVSGELYLGGVQVGRGYVGRGELTAERFVPDGYGEAEGGRLYRTGDVVRLLEDGNLEYLGRLDHQVKLRGQRIELGEIENALSVHSLVRDAVVVAREDAAGEQRLVAYVVAEEQASATGSGAELVRQWKEYLKERLPEYMIPSAFVQLEEMPLTSNGKLDRRALPAPDGMEMDHLYVAPRTAQEEILTGMWQQMLRVPRVGIHDNFFDLGGHSLLATQLMSRVREAFAIEIALRQLFESPTVAALARHIEAALKTDAQLAAPPIIPVSRETALPLSFAQQRLWFIDQLEPGSTLYNVAAAVRLSGQLELKALQQTLDEIVRRHESLRTSFAVVEGEPVHVINPAGRVSLPVIDLSLEAEEAREARARQLAEAEAQQAFDLSRGPLLRTQLLRLEATEHILLVTMHHIVTDGWSLGVLVKEVATLYSAYLEDLPSPLPELTIQYADFAHWQREWLQGEVLEEQLSYWRERLAGAPALLELPTDRARPAVQSFRGAHYSFSVPAELTGELQQLSRREGVTLFMTLLAAFQTLLWRYSGEQDIVVGADVANRNRQETEGLIGFFVNMLVLRTRVEGEESFAELLRQVREVCLGGYAHQDVPFEKLVEELQPERSLSHTPLFQVVFTFQRGLEEALELPNLSLASMDVGSGISKFDLTLYVLEDGDELTGTFEYNTDLFNDATIERMARHLVELLESVVLNPEQKTSEIALLSEGEKRQLFVDFNESAAQFPFDQCVQQIFEEQVDKTPNAVAVEFEGERQTYQQLNNRANRLARHLSELGVGPEMLVALMARRSIDFLTAVLAIFKAGGAYVPLDPLHPSHRLAHVLLQSQSSLVLVAGEFMDVISRALEEVDSVAEPPHVVSLENLLGREREAENLPPRNAPGNLAYVIYTSGSTGAPKGAMLEQRGMCNHLWSKISTLQLTRDDVVAQTASQSFDVSVWQMLAVLMVGGKVLIAGEDLSRDSVGQLKMVAEERITILEIVPSQLRAMVEEMETVAVPVRPNLSSLKWLIVNGEALVPELCRRWFSLYPATPLVNAYGPTECSDDVTQYVIEQSPTSTTTRMPIGEPLANMRMYVLDGKLSPVPLGVTGELYIGGIGVGRGYMREPERTARIYIPDCFGNQPGARLYKTGDRVRWLPDGNLDFIERLDHQVKIRGYRIELGEIEAALEQHGGVKDCVVMVREDTPGLKRLVAYVVAEGASVLADAGELSRHLKERLPEYMIPSAFVQIEEMPLTSNGKLDRRALPAPDFSRSETEQNYVVARTPVEELLVGVWREILGVEHVGIADDFFGLGGHSLLATQLMSRIRKAFAVEIPLRQLFEGPTVAELAQHIEAALKAEAHLQAPPIVPVSREIDLPLSFAQQRLWFLDQLEPNNAFYNVPTALRLNGPLNIAALQQTLDEVVRRHESLRTSFALANGAPVQVISEAATVELPVIDLSREDEETREARARKLAEEEARRPFDLSRGPLLRTQLLRLSENEHVVLFTMHHIVSDGWSMGVLVHEIATLYEAFLQGAASPLPELPVQYADYAYWQRNWLQGEVMEKLLGYWRRRLGGTLPVLNLPTDHVRPALPTFRGRHDSYMIAATLSESLRQLSQQQGATLFMTLLATFKILLMRYTKQEDLIVGTAIANRNRGETEGMIGFFINMLALRTDLSGEPSFRDLLKQVREVALGAYAHQDMPFERLVEEFVPDRAISQTPLVQVAFGFNNAPRQELKLSGLTLSAMPFNDEAGRFDLTLWIDKPTDELRATWYYNTELFEPTTIQRMQGHFETLLRSIAVQPDARLSAMEMLTEEEKQAQAAEQRKRAAANINQFRSVRRKAIESLPVPPKTAPKVTENVTGGD